MNVVKKIRVFTEIMNVCKTQAQFFTTFDEEELEMLFTSYLEIFKGASTIPYATIPTKMACLLLRQLSRLHGIRHGSESHQHKFWC